MQPKQLSWLKVRFPLSPEHCRLKAEGSSLILSELASGVGNRDAVVATERELSSVEEQARQSFYEYQAAYLAGDATHQALILFQRSGRQSFVVAPG